jgi:hypothetical protein
MSTVKQALAIKKLGEQVRKDRIRKDRKGKRISVQKAMLDAGYSANTAKMASKKLLNTKGGREAIRKDFDLDYIFNKHKQNLEAYKFEEIPFGKTPILIAKKIATDKGYKVISAHRRFGNLYLTIELPAYEYVDRALDKVYKLHGAYAPEKIKVEHNYDDMTEEELEALIQEGKKKLAK